MITPRRASDCAVEQDWPAHKERTLAAIGKVNDMHGLLREMVPSIKHLEKLDKIATESEKQTVVLTTVQDRLLSAAIGKEPLTAKTMGLVITGLVVVIVFLLTGSQWQWIGKLHF